MHRKIKIIDWHPFVYTSMTFSFTWRRSIFFVSIFTNIEEIYAAIRFLARRNQFNEYFFHYHWFHFYVVPNVPLGLPVCVLYDKSQSLAYPVLYGTKCDLFASKYWIFYLEKWMFEECYLCVLCMFLLLLEQRNCVFIPIGVGNGFWARKEALSRDKVFHSLLCDKIWQHFGSIHDIKSHEFIKLANRSSKCISVRMSSNISMHSQKCLIDSDELCFHSYNTSMYYVSAVQVAPTNI